MSTNLDPIQFEWDSGNIGKNKHKHNVEDWECEEVYFDTLKLETKDKIHSEIVDRFILVGRTKHNRLLSLVYAIRENDKVRVISARDVTKREELIYYEKAN